MVLKSLALIAVVYMGESECMAKLCNGLIWNLILIYMLKGENNVQIVHPLSINGPYTMMKMQSFKYPA